MTAAGADFRIHASIFKQLGDYFDTINNDVLEDAFFMTIMLQVVRLNLPFFKNKSQAENEAQRMKQQLLNLFLSSRFRLILLPKKYLFSSPLPSPSNSPPHNCPSFISIGFYQNVSLIPVLLVLLFYQFIFLNKKLSYFEKP